MTDARLFDFEALFVESAPDPHPRSTKANRYEFGIAYADPESVPLDGLLEAIGRGLKEDGRDLAKYPHPQGYPSLRELIAEKVAKTRNIEISPDDAMLAAMGENFGSAATWTLPPGGMYIWVTMPDGTDLTGVQGRAVDAGVAFQPGHLYAPDGVTGKNCMRPTFGYNSAEEIRDGIALLADVFEREVVFNK